MPTSNDPQKPSNKKADAQASEFPPSDFAFAGRRMRANPGGQLDPYQVLGREKLIARLWRILDRQSVVLTAERRMGKTCLIKKMAAASEHSNRCIYQDLEALATPLEFVEQVAQAAENRIGEARRTAKRVRRLLQQLGGTQIGRVIKIPEFAMPHWKVLLCSAMEDLLDEVEEPVVWFWDEIPIMLQNIARQSHPNHAMELLDQLRSLRQEHEQLRMVFTGSIGLHHVIGSFRAQGYHNDPTNDMHIELVPPLSEDSALELASALLSGEACDLSEPIKVARAVATEVDGIPYYIHHVVDQLSQLSHIEKQSPITSEHVYECVRHCLLDAQDPWHLQHFRQRIDVLYPEDLRPLALAVLDSIAGASGSLQLSEIHELIQGKLNSPDLESTREVVLLLEKDHYLAHDHEGRYRFLFSIVRRFWCLSRRIA